MTQTQGIMLVLPLAVGLAAIIGTILIQGMALSALIDFVRKEKRLGHAGTNRWTDVWIVALTMSLTLAAHLIEIGLWAVLFVSCGEFSEFATAYYHSAVNFTTLGYGDLILTPHWRLLGPLEAADGMLMFGVSTAMIFAVIQKLVRTRFVDLRD